MRSHLRSGPSFPSVEYHLVSVIGAAALGISP